MRVVDLLRRVIIPITEELSPKTNESIGALVHAMLAYVAPSGKAAEDVPSKLQNECNGKVIQFTKAVLISNRSLLTSLMVFVVKDPSEMGEMDSIAELLVQSVLHPHGVPHGAQQLLQRHTFDLDQQHRKRRSELLRLTITSNEQLQAQMEGDETRAQEALPAFAGAIVKNGSELVAEFEREVDILHVLAQHRKFGEAKRWRTMFFSTIFEANKLSRASGPFNWAINLDLCKDFTCRKLQPLDTLAHQSATTLPTEMLARADKLWAGSSWQVRLEQTEGGDDGSVSAPESKKPRKKNFLRRRLGGALKGMKNELGGALEGMKNLLGVGTHSSGWDVYCEVVKAGHLVPAMLHCSGGTLCLRESTGLSEDFEPDDIETIKIVRYELIYSALWLELKTLASPLMLNFGSVKSLDKVYALLHNLKPAIPQLHLARKRPHKLLKELPLTQRWQRREISNFDYLMHLNHYAGRTQYDLSAYPVFPWVLADYTSSKLDFRDPATFRDLSKSIGALNEARLAKFKERFDEAEELQQEDNALFTTHYSSEAIVVLYLMRLEPFSSIHKSLHDGHFDQPDRQFSSVEQMWCNGLDVQLLADVKELTPEWYYLAAFLQRSNTHDFGTLPSGERVDAVSLPPWAEGSAERFVALMRAALESDIASDSLNEWIDLVFGYKQKGEEALKASNLFPISSYEKANNEHLSDTDREVLRCKIKNWGQTPAQLFKTPHPRRDKADATLRALFRIGDFMMHTLDLSWSDDAGFGVQRINAAAGAVALLSAPQVQVCKWSPEAFAAGMILSPSTARKGHGVSILSTLRGGDGSKRGQHATPKYEPAERKARQLISSAAELIADNRCVHPRCMIACRLH
jgi:hypothetical protein